MLNQASHFYMQGDYMSVEVVTDENFAERIERYQGVALVDFWAPWCVPCQLVNPLLEKLAHQYEGKVRIARLNVDEQPQIAARYQILSIPSFTTRRAAELVDTLRGVGRAKADRAGMRARLERAPIANR